MSFDFLFEKKPKKKEKFVQEYLYIEETPPPEPEKKDESKDAPERGITTIELV